MIYAKSVNIASQSHVPYDDTKQQGVTFSFGQTTYINYNNQKYIGGSEYALWGNRCVVQGFVTDRDCENGSFTFSIPIIMLKYQYVNARWTPTGSVFKARRLMVFKNQYEGRLDAEESTFPYQQYTVGKIMISSLTTTAISEIYLNFGTSSYYYPVPYTQAELEAYAQSNFSAYPTIISEIQALSYGGIVCNVHNFVGFNTVSQPTINQRSGGSEGRIYAELLAEGTGDLSRLNPACIIPFSSENECRAAKCAYTRWARSPYYPIT